MPMPRIQSVHTGSSRVRVPGTYVLIPSSHTWPFHVIGWPNVYFQHNHQGRIILILYVDDLMITSTCLSLIRDLKALLHSEFRMMDLGEIQKFLGVDFTRTPAYIFLHQSQYAKQTLADFRMEDAHPNYVPMTEGLQLRIDTQTPPCDPLLYRARVGQLQWLTKTCFDIARVVGKITNNHVFHDGPKHSKLIGILLDKK